MEQQEIEHNEWKKIQEVITGTFRICECQRKIKTIVDNLYEICVKLDERNFTFTGTEWLLIAMMDKSSNLVTHGINCEYPILNKEDIFWQWIVEVKDSPYLKDN